MFKKLENVYEREVSQMSLPELKSLIIDIKEYANLFKENIEDLNDNLNDPNRTELFKFGDDVRRLLLILNKFKVQMFYPYVLKCLKEADLNPKGIEDLKILESFIVRRKISPKGTHDYTSKCYKILTDGINSLIEDDLGNDNAGITDVDVKDYLSRVKDEDAKMILFWIELYLRNNQKYDTLGFCKWQVKIHKKWQINFHNSKVNVIIPWG